MGVVQKDVGAEKLELGVEKTVVAKACATTYQINLIKNCLHFISYFINFFFAEKNAPINESPSGTDGIAVQCLTFLPSH